MYEDMLGTLRVGLAAIAIASLVGIVLTLVVFRTELISEQSEYLEEGTAVMRDDSLTYVDDYDIKATENEHRPEEIVEESSSFWGYIGLGICVVGIILACRKILLDILYAVFPFAFKVMQMENEQKDEKTEDITNERRKKSKGNKGTVHKGYLGNYQGQAFYNRNSYLWWWSYVYYLFSWKRAMAIQSGRNGKW